MSVDSLALGLVAWLATYAVHSTVLLGSAWLFASRLGRGAHREEERWWKVALVAGLLTATGQTLCGVRPFTGELVLPAVEARTASSAAESAPVETFEPATSPLRFALPATTGAAEGAVLELTPLETPEETTALRAWVPLVAGTWLVGSSLGLLGLLMSCAGLQRLLRHRTPLTTSDGGRRGAFARLFEELARDAGLAGRVRLSATNQLRSPVTLGCLRREVCVPHAAVDLLRPDEQRALLAHELAHARRHDPAWLVLLNVLNRALFFQPLLRVARTRQERLAEYQCDDWAVERTRDPVSLASCLTEVAGWVVGRRTPRLAPTMAATAGELDVRVRRLLTQSARAGRGRHALLPLALATGLGVLLGAPALSATPADTAETARTEDERATLAPGATFSLGYELDPLPSGFVALELEVTPETLLSALDGELHLLRGELDALRREADALDAAAVLSASLDDVEARIDSLVERRRRLAELLPAITTTPRPASQPAER